MCLSETPPKRINHKIVFDNYFTEMSLIRELKREGIHSLGIVRKNKVMGCCLKDAKDLKKKVVEQSTLRFAKKKIFVLYVGLTILR